MLGIEQAGISETIAFILNHYPRELQTTLVQVGYFQFFIENVFKII